MLSCSPRTKLISVETPARPAGQESVRALAAVPIDTVRVGFVGLGMRGSRAVHRFTSVPDSKITALCDIENDRVQKCAEYLENKGLHFKEVVDTILKHHTVLASLL